MMLQSVADDQVIVAGPKPWDQPPDPDVAENHLAQVLSDVASLYVARSSVRQVPVIIKQRGVGPHGCFVGLDLRNALVATILTVWCVSGAFASSGTAVGVIPDAETSLAGAVVKLVVGTDVEIGQTVTTGPAGQAELLFSDGTKLVVGPQSAVLIEDYLFRSDGGAGKFAIDALGGTFRFFTGTMPKSSYRIGTPTGTIGVRGTIFELFVAKSGDALIALLEGSVRICSKGKKSECEDLGITPSQVCGVSFIGNGSTGFEDLSTDAYFPYLASQENLHDPFRVKTAGACKKFIDAGQTGSIEQPIQASPN